MKEIKIYRQGDVLIERIKEIPKQAKVVPRENGRVILAHGEATGHAHAIEDEKVKLLEDSGATFLEVQEAIAMLKHEEHSTIEIPKGNYRVIRQREYSPEAIRNVMD